LYCDFKKFLIGRRFFKRGILQLLDLNASWVREVDLLGRFNLEAQLIFNFEKKRS